MTRVTGKCHLVCHNTVRGSHVALERAVIYRFYDFELDTDCFELRARGSAVVLARRPFDLLLCLIERRQRVVLKHELFDLVWGGCCVSDATLSHCVMELRRALSDVACQPRFLRTIRGRGYRFIAGITPDGGEEPQRTSTLRIHATARTL